MTDLSHHSIATKRLKLLPISQAYSAVIFSEFTPQITTYMYPKPPESIADTQLFITMSQQAMVAGEELVVVIINAATNEFLGGGGLHGLKTPTPELGIWIKQSAHGHYYGREAVTGLKEWADQHLTFEHLKYPVDKRNVASRKIAESLGGVVRAEYQKANQSGDILDEVEYWITQ